MARNRRQVSAFSLSFLDIMSCGFGAVVLLFLIIKHNIDTNVPRPVSHTNMDSEVVLLEEEILDGRKNLAKIRNTISEIDQELVQAQGLAARITAEIKKNEGLTNELIENADVGMLDQLKADIKKLDIQKKQLSQELAKSGEDARKYSGKGDRAYVTGLKMGGKRVLVLLDISASMLDQTIINILRRRNMRDERQRTAEKWKRALKTVDWLSAKFPISSQYQIYTFNTETNAIVEGTKGKWLNVRNKVQLDGAIDKLSLIIPEKGTNLEKAFIAASELRPLPDSINLITDGLPTTGSKAPRGATISGKDRLKLFNRAIEKIPNRVPVNVIMLPMEGDPEAAKAFWQFALNTEGSFMSPSKDWP